MQEINCNTYNTTPHHVQNAWICRLPADVLIDRLCLLFLRGKEAIHFLNSCWSTRHMALQTHVWRKLLQRDFPWAYTPLYRVISPTLQQAGKSVYAREFKTAVSQLILRIGRTEQIWYKAYATLCLQGEPWSKERQWNENDGSSLSALIQLTDGYILAARNDGKINTFMTNGGPSTTVFTHATPISCMIRLTDGRIAFGDDNGDVIIWNLVGALSVLHGHQQSVNCLVQLTDGRLASGSKNGTIQTWNLMHGTSVSHVTCTSAIRCLIRLIDGRLAFGTHNGEIGILNVDTYSVRKIKGVGSSIYCLLQLADGRIAAGDGVGKIYLYDVNGSSSPILLGNLGSYVFKLAQLPDERLISASHDRTVRIWDLNGTSPSILRGHTAAACGLVLLSNGKIVSGSDHEICIWQSAATQLGSRTVVAEVTPRSMLIAALAISILAYLAYQFLTSSSR